MACPALFTLLDFELHWGLVCSRPEPLIGDSVWPSNIEKVSETSVDESLELVCVGRGHVPRF